jgi:FkbM family methyltransferase
MKSTLKKILSLSLGRQSLHTGGKKVRLKALPDDLYESLDALKCCIWYNQYGGYCLPESSLHRTAPRKILRGDVYEPGTIEFMRRHCGTGDIVHAGTYFGDFLPALSTACAPEAQIWAFEPNPENYRCARITMLINDLQNVSLLNAGLGAEPDTLSMRVREMQGRSLGGKSHLVEKSDFDPVCDVEVGIVPIDSIVGNDRTVSIIQLDVEGHEQAALHGALGTIRRCLPILILEVRRDSTLLDSNWFEETILSLGYAETGTVHGNSVFEHSA